MNAHPSSPRRRARIACVASLAATLLLTVAALAEPDPNADNPSAPAATDRAKAQPIVVDRLRAHDARGLNVFEAPKSETVPYDGFKIQWGAAFTQQWQDLNHENTADSTKVTTPATVQLFPIGAGFNNADANLYMDAQLARGMRVALTSYMSSRHHPEMWVKDGYLLVDGSPYENELLDNLMEYLTLRIGHFEINYGDQHFRRTDNGNALYNPFVGNLIMDAFTTEVGAEAYVRAMDLMGMLAVTGGEVRGTVTKPENRSPAIMGKVGFDRQFNEQLRVRLTGSLYTTSKSNSNTLYSGNRAGSRYYYVVENKNASESAQAWSGDLQPGFSRKVTAWVVNPFIKFQNLELFGNIEQAKGRRITETTDREWTQYSGEGLIRLLGNQVYVAGRYNTAKGDLLLQPQVPPGPLANYEVTINRFEVSGGWFLTQNLLAKAEYVKQEYKDFPVFDIRNGAQFDGLVIEAVVSF